MGSSSDGFKSSRKIHLNLLIPILLVFVTSCDCHVGDSCDWNGSGLSSFGQVGSNTSREERGVQPLYFRCRQGRIRWSYPSGALRLLLRLQGSGSKEFRACLRPGVQFGGARVFLEGHRRLHLLFSPDDSVTNEVVDSGKTRKIFCIASVRGQAAVYVEATPPVRNVSSIKKSVVELAYDLQPVSTDALQNPLEECRPCTDEELLQYYCSSDYVVTGMVTSLSHDFQQERDRLDVRVHRVHRDSPVHPAIRSGHETDDSYYRTTSFYRPLKCETKAGSGMFMFLARRLLGDPYLTCAPRLNRWKVLRAKAIHEGSSPCLLD